MKKKFILILLVLITCMFQSFAADKIPQTHANILDGYVSFLYVTADEAGTIYVALDSTRGIAVEGSGTALGSGTKAAGYLILENHINRDEMMALLYMAKAMDQTVRFRVSSNIISGYNTISYITGPY